MKKITEKKTVAQLCDEANRKAKADKYCGSNEWNEKIVDTRYGPAIERIAKGPVDSTTVSVLKKLRKKVHKEIHYHENSVGWCTAMETTRDWLDEAIKKEEAKNKKL